MAFNGDEGSVVTLAEASCWTANYRRTIPTGEIISQFVGRNKLMEILNQDECIGVRIYYGVGDDGKKNLILVGAKADENDMEQGVIVERVIPCPPKCPRKNPLNS
ncbi:MAG TPA: hypothetical protein DEF82_00755 [Crocinitomicaceae bacterium]|nr:hypothetical protein [Flavobacteriia bacterium]HBW85311.1 hypothetical protein [Crocinitomicaceae bacterium]